MIICFKTIPALIVVYILMFGCANGQAVTIDNLALTATSGLTMTILGDFKNQNNGSINNAGTITVSGNWTNNASTMVFSTNSGLVQLIGTSAQTIDGTYSTSFYNLTLNNTVASPTRYTLGIDQSIKNTLTLTAGQVNLAAHTMTIGTSASSAGTLTHTAGWLYGGTLKRWFNTSTIPDAASAGFFPIGSSANFRSVYVSAPSVGPVSGGTISVSYTELAGNTPVSIFDNPITIDRKINSYWSLAAGNGLTGGTYNMRVDGNGSTGITDYTLLRLILAGSTVGTAGINIGSNASPQVIRTGLSVTDLTNTFYYGYPAAAALPIELISFKAKREYSDVIVSWVTATEINTDYFIVERSADGNIYETVTTVQGAGNSNSNKYYSIIDSHPLPGLSFYRLREIDFDGLVVLFPPVSIHIFNMNSEFEIASIRSLNDQIVINILSSGQDDFVLELFDDVGKLISHQSGKMTTGSQDIIIPLNNKASSIYILNLKTSESIISKKIIYKIQN